MARIGGGSVRHPSGWSLYLGRLGPRPARGQPCVPRSADVALNLDVAKLPLLDVAVPEIKIGKGTRRSAIELRQPKPTIGFEPIPAAYKAK